MKSIPDPTYIPNLLDLDDTILAGSETLAHPIANDIFTPTHAAIIRLNACRVRRFFSIHLNTDNDETKSTSINPIPAIYVEAMNTAIADIAGWSKSKNTIKNARLLQMAIHRCLCFYTAGQYDYAIRKFGKREPDSKMRMRREKREQEEQEIMEARLWTDAMERETAIEQQKTLERRQKREQRKAMYAGISKTNTSKDKGRRGASSVTSSSVLSTPPSA